MAHSIRKLLKCTRAIICKFALELLFSPLVAGTTQGSVAFVNPQAGEFWYELKLVAERVANEHQFGVARVETEDITEVILALNATVDGQTTAHYIADRINGLGDDSGDPEDPVQHQ